MSDRPPAPAASAERKRLVMVTGVQRSGTTAVFGELSRSPGVSARDESIDDPLYREYYLRPEPQIRGLLDALPGTVLLKPVRETVRRPLLAVSDEYDDYDLRLIWLYRDPVNVFASWVQKGWTKDVPDRVVAFAYHWCRRNESALAAAATLGPRLVIVNYEDLCSARALLPRLARLVGLSSKGSLRTDGRGGRRKLAPSTQATLDAMTRDVRRALDDARSLRPAPTVATRWKAFVSRCVPTAADTPRDRSESDAPEAPVTETSSALLRPEYAPVLSTTDPAPFYRQWHAWARPAGWIGRKNRPVAVGFDVSRALLAGPVSIPPLRFAPDDRDDRRVWLEGMLAESRAARADAARESVRRHVETHSKPRRFMLSACLRAIARDVNAEWMGCPASLLAGVCENIIRSTTVEGIPSRVDGAAAAVKEMPSAAILPRLLERELLTAAAVPGFLADTALRTYLLSTVVPNALVVAARQPPLLDRLREAPETIPGFLMEALRLAPTWVAVKCQVAEAIRDTGLDVPAGATVDVFVGAANRDPAVFTDPDRCLLDRTGPRPILIETATANSLRLRDDAPWTAGSLLLDVSLMVLEALITADQPLRILSEPTVRLVPRAYGSCWTRPGNLVVAIDA